VADDILTLLTIEGNDSSWYKLVTAEKIVADYPDINVVTIE
jgi:hypothetical protein